MSVASASSLDAGELPVRTRRASPEPRYAPFAWAPRWLRLALTAFAFAMFFALAACFGALALLLGRSDASDRRRFTRRLNLGFRPFLAFLRDLGLIAYWPPSLPAHMEGRAFLLVANHPTLLDVVILLGSMPELLCVVKASWYRSLLLGPLLARTAHVPGPGHEGDDAKVAPVVDRIEQALRSGAPLLVFPEGTRSSATALRRFRRGALEAAQRAEVPVLPLFIGAHPPALMKGQRQWGVPGEAVRFTFAWLDDIEPHRASSAELAETLHGQLSICLAEHRRAHDERSAHQERA